ncbi:MAG: hypothetical protein HYX76_11755, partial [Acidobacteria bacterium]|nr:hypothetical protein [Acidobacteriota bacterium]
FNTWSHRFVVYDATALFPGVVALVLAGGALVTGVAVRDRRARACLAIAFVGFILSFGPQTPVYTLAYHAFPLMHAVRAASRFAVLVLFGIAALAGFGLASLLPPIERRSTRGHTLARAVVAAAIVFANLEALRAPITYVPFRGIPRIYEVLRTEPDPVVAAELPMYRAPDIARNARYELHSTRYWKPLVNGYSGIVPAAYEARAEALRGFPNDASREALHAAGVTHVIVHLDAFGELPPALNRVEWLVPLATSRNIRIYRLRSR